MDDTFGNFTAYVNGHVTARNVATIRSDYRAMLKDIGDRISHRLNAVGLSATAASKKAGLSADAIRNIQRAIKSGSRHGVSTDTLLKLAPVLETSAGWLLTGEGKPQDGIAAAPVGPITELPIRGEVAAGLWREVDEISSFDSEHLMVPVAPTPGIPAEFQFCVVARGTSLNKLARDGDILVCTDIIKSGLLVNDGDLVVVERKRYQGSLREVTAKRVRRANGGFELHPESTDPAFQEPIRVSEGEHDDQEINIIAKVLWIMRKP